MACAAALSAQSDMRGHWSGNIDSPLGPLVMEVDLDKAGDGWIGSISIPAQGASGMPLDKITFADGKAAFHLKGGPLDPAWTGTLSADGKTLDGTFTQGPQSTPLKFSRTGEPKVALLKPSPAVAAQFVGTWDGTIDMGAQLRVRLTIRNGSSGSEAVIVSLDQGNLEIPVSEIAQQGTKLTLNLKMVGGDFSGEMNAQGTEIKGTWSQLGNSSPLVFTRPK